MAITLLADIGGTNARFALCSDGVIRDARTLPCADFPDIGSAARAYLKSVDAAPSDAAFAVAAPLGGDFVRMTNHVWQFSVNTVRRELQVDRLRVFNDFTALALAIRYLPANELQQIGGGPPVPNAPIALLGPGTGLGVSGLVPAANGFVPLQGEGGHVTLAASNEREDRVLQALRARFDHVSAERVLSGPGLVNLLTALCALDAATSTFDSPSVIVDAGLQRTDAHCSAALDLFCAMLGSVAGNLALTLGAVGGVYIGGGIVPRLKGYFAQSSFRERFEAKGRYAAYLAPIPVFVIHSEWPAFVGLARAFIDSAPHVEG